MELETGIVPGGRGRKAGLARAGRARKLAGARRMGVVRIAHGIVSARTHHAQGAGPRSGLAVVARLGVKAVQIQHGL